MNLLFVFTRPFGKNYTKYFKKRCPEGWKVIYISDFKYRDDVGLVSLQNRYFQSNKPCTSMDKIDISTVVMRDRYLKHIPFNKAKRLVESAYFAIKEIFEKYKPKVFFGFPIDNYYLDLIDQYCRLNNIYSINPISHFLPNLSRVTTRGQLINCRDVEKDEISKIYDYLSRNDIKPTWLHNKRSSVDLFKLYARERCKKIFFTAMKIIKSEPYSFHYNCIYPMPGAITVRSLNVMKVGNYLEKSFEKIDKMSQSYRKVVFFPLQFTPEASLNYFINDSRFSNYEDFLSRFLDVLPEDTIIIFKEHPDIYGYRDCSFYDKILSARNNVVIADPSISVQQLFKISDIVCVTGNASTGAEAVFKGKAVLSFGGAFYNFNGEVFEIRNFDDVKKWPIYLDRKPNILDERTKKEEWTKKLLQGSELFNYRFVRVRSRNTHESINSTDGWWKHILRFASIHAK